MATQPQTPPSTVGKKLAAGGAVGFAGAGVAGLAPTVAGGAAVAATAALSTSAVARLTSEIIESTLAHFRQRAPRTEAEIRDRLATTMPSRHGPELDALAREEAAREREFQRRMVERLRRDLPTALAEPDPDRRRAAVRSLLERERRYVEMREEAITDRAVARTEREAVKDASPQGAYWFLSPFVMKHTPDCIALGGKFWPWEFLDEVHPLLHNGCRCQLLTLDDAVARGYMHPDQVGDPAQMTALGHKLYADAMAVAEAVSEEEWALWLAELAEAAPPELGLSSFPPQKLDVEEGASLGGAMVALYPNAETQRRIAGHPQADEPASKIHLTLAFLTDDAATLDQKARARIRSAVKRAAASAAPLSGEVGGIAMFSGKPGEPRPLVATASVPGLNEFRAALVKALGDDMPEERFGFTPHITMRYVPREEGPVAALPPRAKLAFDDVHLVMAGERESFPLGVDLKEVYLEEGYERRWPTGTREGGRFRPRVGGTAHELSRMKRAFLRDLVPALPLTPALSRAARRGQERDVNGRRVFVPEHRAFDRVVGGRRAVSPPGTTRVFGSSTKQSGSQGKPEANLQRTGRRQPAVWDKLRPHRVAADEDAARKAGAADADTPPVAVGDPAARAERALRSAGFVETGYDGGVHRYLSRSGELEVRYGADGRAVERVSWRPPPVAGPEHELARPPRTFEEFGDDLVAFARRQAIAAGHQTAGLRVVSDDAYADHAAETFGDGEIRLGTDFAPSVLAGASARERGMRPTDSQLQGLWAAAQSGRHEALHAANPMSLELMEEPENTNLDEALAEELSPIEAAHALRRQGQQDVLDWAADHPWDPKRLGTYPAERAALGRLLDRAGVEATGREGALRRLLSAPPAGRWAVLQRMGVPEAEAREGMRTPPYPEGGFAPLLAIPADPTFAPSGFTVGGEDLQAGDRLTGRDGRVGTVLALGRRGGSALAAVGWDDGEVDPAVAPGDIATAQHSPARVAGSAASSAGGLVEGGGAEWHGGKARVVRVLRPGDDWLVEGRTANGDPVLLTPRNTPGLRAAAAEHSVPMGPPTPVAPLEARAALAGRFAFGPATEIVPTSSLVPTARPPRRPRWPGKPAPPLDVRPRTDGRLDVVGGNEVYARAVEDGLAWLPIQRPLGPVRYPELMDYVGGKNYFKDLAERNKAEADDLYRADALRDLHGGGGRGNYPVPASWKEPLTADELVAMVKGGPITQDEWRAGLEGGLEAMLHAGYVLTPAKQAALDAARGGRANPEPDEYRGSHGAPGPEPGSSMDDLGSVYPPDVYGPDAARLYGHQSDDEAARRDEEMAAIIRSAKGRPDKAVTVYRAVPDDVGRDDRLARLVKERDAWLARARWPEGTDTRGMSDADYYDWLSGEVARLEGERPEPGPSIAPGDWVTPSRAYAVMHGESNLGYPDREGEWRPRYKIISRRVRAGDLDNEGDLYEWGWNPRGRRNEAVDAGGEMRLWHGTPVPGKVRAEGLAFADGVGYGGGPSIWLSNSRAHAEGYGTPVRVAAKFRRPLVVDLSPSGTGSWADDFEAALKREGVDTAKYPRLDGGGLASPGVVARKEGFDAVVRRYPDTVYGAEVPEDLRVIPGNVIVNAFDPASLRVLDGNEAGGRRNDPIFDRPWPWQKKQETEKEAVDAMHGWAEAVHGDAPTESAFKEKAHKQAPKTVWDDSGTVRVLGSAGGSNGARWAEGADGTRYVVKTYRGDVDRVATEALSNALYRRLGVRVPEGGLLSFGGTPAFTSRVVDAQRRRWREPDPQLGAGFMADALLGNWDVVGLEQDNVLWDADGPIRVDQGGTLEYRAMGSRKEFGPVPSEVWTMAGPRGQAFGSMELTDAGRRAGARRIARVLDEATIDSLVDAAPFKDEAMRERVRDSLRSRVAWMGRYAAGEETVPGPLEGVAASAAWAKAQEHLALYPEQDIALQGFVNGWEVPVNEHLRSGKGKKDAAPEVGFIVRELDSLLSHATAPADMRVYFALPDAAAASTLAGKEVRERGYLGATLDEGAALETAGPKGAVVSLLVPAGVGGVLTHATPAENLPPEPQVLLERGLRLRVGGVRHEGSRVVVDAAAL